MSGCQVLVWDSRAVVETFQLELYIPISIRLLYLSGIHTTYTDSCGFKFFKFINPHQSSLPRHHGNYVANNDFDAIIRLGDNLRHHRKWKEVENSWLLNPCSNLSTLRISRGDGEAPTQRASLCTAVRQSRGRGWLGDVGHVRVVSVLSTAIWKVLVGRCRRRKSW